jgi:hypothetical protein
MCPRPPAPITTARVPEPRTGIAFLTAWIAVSPASASAAMSFGSSPCPSLTTDRALVCRYSANPPSRPIPGKLPFAQCMSSPSRHARHNPHVMNGCTITVSPTATLVTPEPTSSIQPAFSCPGTYGNTTPDFSAHCPSWICRSVRHNPAAPIRTTTSNGPDNFGSAISSTFRSS